MKPASTNQRLYWCAGGGIEGFGNIGLSPDRAAELRRWYFGQALSLGVETERGRYCIRAGRELREAMDAASRHQRASGCLSDIQRRDAA